MSRAGGRGEPGRGGPWYFGRPGIFYATAARRVTVGGAIRFRAFAIPGIERVRRRGLISRVGLGHDTHRLAPGRPLILGGVTIDHELGLLGHSDADVVMHAVADALLGAAGLGDIGEHFPDTDPEWAGVSGERLLGGVLAMIANAGWAPSNCDVVIHAQRPKLAGAKREIRRNLARVLGLPEDAVNVKAKTGELVGHIGRGEAIACHAVVLCRASGVAD